MATKSDLLVLLADIKPELQCRINNLIAYWPGSVTLTALHRNETLMKRLNEALK